MRDLTTLFKPPQTRTHTQDDLKLPCNNLKPLEILRDIKYISSTFYQNFNSIVDANSYHFQNKLTSKSRLKI